MSSDESIRRFAQIEIIVKAEPVIGDPPEWANTIEIADEAIKIASRRYREWKEQHPDSDD